MTSTLFKMLQSIKDPVSAVWSRELKVGRPEKVGQIGQQS